MEPLGHAITDCTVLWSLVGTYNYHTHPVSFQFQMETKRRSKRGPNINFLGHIAHELRHISCNTATFLGMKLKMQSMWDRQQSIWVDVIEKLPILKMAHSDQSPYSGKTVTYLETQAGQRSETWGHLYKRFMPLPSCVLLFPRFR